MRKSTVIAIIAVIVALIAIRGVQEIARSRQKAPLGSAFVKILPKDMRAADVHKIEIYRGQTKDEAIILARGEAGWTVPSRFSSKGNEKNVSELLDEIKNLTGEVRTKKASLHEDFGITETKAVHIALYDKKGKLSSDLLLGKKGERWSEGFVRLARSNEVYLADKNLLSTLGIYSDDAKPDAKKWLDLKIVDRESEKVAKVALDMPGKQVVLEKKEKKKEEKEKPEEGKEPSEPQKEKEEKKEYEWVLLSPKTDFTLRDWAAKSLVNSASQVSAEDVADPAKMSEYGFDAPTYAATITMDDGSSETLLVGKKAEKDDKRYAKLKEGQTAYILAQYTVQGVFKKMRDLLDIKIWDLKKEDVASIALQRPGYEIALERRPKEGTEGKEPKDYQWVLAKPQSRFALDDSAITTILNGLSKPSPEDLFTTGEPQTYALDSPESKAAVTMKDNSAHSVLFGKKLEGSDDRYVKFEGREHYYSVTKSSFENVFPRLTKLLKIEIVKDLEREDVLSLRYDTAEEDFVLARKEKTGEADKEKWSLKTEKEELEAKTGIVDSILDAITDIKPEDMVIGKSDGDCGLDKPPETLAISTKKAADQFVLLVGSKPSEDSSDRYFKVKDQPEIFVLSNATFRDIFRELKDLKVEKPAEQKEEKKPSAEESVVPYIEPPPPPPIPTPTTDKPPAEKGKPKEAPEKKGEVSGPIPPEAPPEKKEEPQPPVPEKETPPS